MTTAKLPPLPADYVRPSLAAFLAAAKTHTAAEHIPWCERYEAALRRHSASAQGAPVLAAAEAAAPLELATMGDPSEPWEYVRDAGGIITGTRSLKPSAAASEPEPAELSEPEPVLPAFAEFVLAATGQELSAFSSDEFAALAKIYGWGPSPKQASEYRETHKLESWAAMVAHVEAPKDNAPAVADPANSVSEPEPAPVELSSAAVKGPESAHAEPSSAAVSEPESAAAPLAELAT